MSQRKKHELKNLDLFTVSEPRFVKKKKPMTIKRFTVFSPTYDAYVEEGLSHAIYDIEINSSLGLTRKNK